MYALKKKNSIAQSLWRPLRPVPTVQLHKPLWANTHSVDLFTQSYFKVKIQVAFFILQTQLQLNQTLVLLGSFRSSAFVTNCSNVRKYVELSVVSCPLSGTIFLLHCLALFSFPFSLLAAPFSIDLIRWAQQFILTSSFLCRFSPATRPPSAPISACHLAVLQLTFTQTSTLAVRGPDHMAPQSGPPSERLPPSKVFQELLLPHLAARTPRAH